MCYPKYIYGIINLQNALTSWLWSPCFFQSSFFLSFVTFSLRLRLSLSHCQENAYFTVPFFQSGRCLCLCSSLSHIIKLLLSVFFFFFCITLWCIYILWSLMDSEWYSCGLPCWHLPRSLCKLADTYRNACIYIDSFLTHPNQESAIGLSVTPPWPFFSTTNPHLLLLSQTVASSDLKCCVCYSKWETLFAEHKRNCRCNARVVAVHCRCVGVWSALTAGVEVVLGCQKLLLSSGGVVSLIL